MSTSVYHSHQATSARKCKKPLKKNSAHHVHSLFVRNKLSFLNLRPQKSHRKKYSVWTNATCDSQKYTNTNCNAVLKTCSQNQLFFSDSITSIWTIWTHKSDKRSFSNRTQFPPKLWEFDFTQWTPPPCG